MKSTQGSLLHPLTWIWRHPDLGARSSIPSFTVRSNFNNVDTRLRERHYSLGFLCLNNLTFAVTLLPIENLWTIREVWTIFYSVGHCKWFFTAYYTLHSGSRYWTPLLDTWANVVQVQYTDWEVYIEAKVTQKECVICLGSRDEEEVPKFSVWR